jgi:hypothetical protein
MLGRYVVYNITATPPAADHLSNRSQAFRFKQTINTRNIFEENQQRMLKIYHEAVIGNISQNSELKYITK